MQFVHDEVVKRMNEGKWFEQIFHEMMEIFPKKFQYQKFLRGTYGCYQFAIHATYRLYHGWYNTGNPTDLYPAKSDDIAREFLQINSPENYLEHGKKLYEQGKLQLALHIIDVIIKAPELANKEVLIEAYDLKAKILKQKGKEELSFIAKNSFFNGAASMLAKIKELKST